jgi:hypothetical protein
MRRFLIACVVAALLAPAALADGAETAALGEIADALIQKGPDGVAYGARYYQSLPVTADGKRLIKIYMQPYPREVALINRNLWYQLADAAPVGASLQQWVLEEYRGEFPQLSFEVTNDPAQATMFMLEARFVPNPQSGKQRATDNYYKTAANSMNAKVGANLCALIHFNSIGNPWLRKAIDEGKSSVVRATILNELFNGFAVSDFQDLDAGKLSPATQAWLAAHRTTIDDYTITRSGGPMEDVHLKALDHVIVEKLFR